MKSEIEIKFDKLSKEYLEKFGVSYPLMITGQKSLAEICAEIERCLKSGKQAKEPKYKDDGDY